MSNEAPTCKVRSFITTLFIFVRHYRQSPLQAGAILLGITLAVTLFVGVQAINANAKRSYIESSEQLSARASYQVLPMAGKRTFDELVYFKLRKQGVSLSLPVIEGVLTDDQGKRWTIQGSDLLAALTSLQPQDSNDDVQTGLNRTWSEQIPLGKMLAGEAVVLVSQAELASRGKWRVNGIEFEVVTLPESSELGNRLLMDISLAQRLLDRQGELSYIALFTTQLPSGIDKWIEGQATLQRNESGNDLQALTDSFHLNLTAMSLLAFLVGLFIAYNGVRYSLLKRDRLLMQLQHVGIAKKTLLSALVVELTLLVVLGSAIGFVLGLQLSHWLHPLVAITLEQLYSATLLPGEWKVAWFIQAMLLSLISALVACSAQFVKMINTPLSRSVGYYQFRESSAQFKWLFSISSILLVSSLIGISISDHYRVTLFSIGLMVIGAPLTLPLLLHISLQWLATRGFSGLNSYAISEAKELVAPLSLAMMAMLIAVSSNIAINTLVGSFESTLRNWLDGRLHAELYIGSVQQDHTVVLEYLETHPQVSKVYTQTYLLTNYRGLPINVGTKDQYTMAETTLFRSSQKDAWESFYDNQSVFISEATAVKLNLTVGDQLALPFLNEVPLTVSGIFYDYGNPKGEVLIAPSLWRQYGFTSVPSSLGVGVEGDVARLKFALNQDLGLSNNQMIDQLNLKQLAISIFSRTFAITQALNVLTLMVAAIGLFTACYLIGQSRVSSVAKLYCLGVKRRSMRMMLIGQMGLLVGLTCLMAIPIGYVLGMLLTENVTLQAFGWTLFFEWDWPKVGMTIGITLLASFCATLFPLLQQTKRPLLANLQSEVL
ncbi:ABC transporter permease [Vibrio ulleungensis]|uniref:ABC transporter permease n=1 Tax=Vibrio ulleungensis TaxID=2807619 RepID=A0ABS2HLN7_9VIBR|nr:ABC transporter permease [Vibrio ulleungensis]MBM7037037.1 ABC transporter permease [Vibrio ulleungensis]